VDFEQIRVAAHEAEMWSTLAVNSGILFSTITAAWFLFALGKEPTFAQILAAAGLGLGLVFGSLIGAESAWTFQFLINGQPPSTFDYIVGVAIVLFVVIGGAVYLALLLRADRLKASKTDAQRRV